ncbi:ADP-ribosylglycohydrolase family protein [Halobellus sp. Atlit-38R]|uniref:ADP-ribosylglycohydrolase family protein n=1 Tax=Halobellus sp. Atlit-38R TaxID=2282131 RepID=UPI000EF1A8B2|nr:ADP-ribosylglycohydrolase family protein [Halobellus sp. Atlit-38R]RLM88658.1 ADP-ribosylglycohydrolase family protein [Halobellus sp. Atlit-38R]
MTVADAAQGMLLGLACGDALGRPVEFTKNPIDAGEHGQITTMLGHGTHGQPAGTVTDDTDQALCIARSLRARDAFDPADIAARFVEWYQDGPFDIGLMTVDALRQLKTGAPWGEAGRRVWEHRAEGQNAGNGSVMRCAPLSVAYASDTTSLINASKQSSVITHYDPRCQYGCAVLNLTLKHLLHSTADPLQTALEHVNGEAPAELVNALDRIPNDITPADLSTSGYVVTTLQTALYHGLTAESAREAIIDAVNMGGDADTIGAITGAVAGARYGSADLPDEWSSNLRGITETELRNLADQLHHCTFPPVEPLTE